MAPSFRDDPRTVPVPANLPKGAVWIQPEVPHYAVPIQEKTFGGQVVWDAGRMVLFWSAESYSTFTTGVNVRLRGPADASWIALGISDNGLMPGSLAVVADWSSGRARARKYKLDGYQPDLVTTIGSGTGTGFERLAVGRGSATGTLEDVVAERSDGVSWLRFNIPFTMSCNEGHLKVCSDAPTHFIVAHGYSGTPWKSKHAYSASQPVDIPKVVFEFDEFDEDYISDVDFHTPHLVFPPMGHRSSPPPPVRQSKLDALSEDGTKCGWFFFWMCTDNQGRSSAESPHSPPPPSPSPPPPNLERLPRPPPMPSIPRYDRKAGADDLQGIGAGVLPGKGQTENGRQAFLEPPSPPVFDSGGTECKWVLTYYGVRKKVCTKTPNATDDTVSLIDAGELSEGVIGGGLTGVAASIVLLAGWLSRRRLQGACSRVALTRRRRRAHRSTQPSPALGQLGQLPKHPAAEA